MKKNALYNSSFKKALPTYFLLILLPSLFGLLLYFCILKINKELEIEKILNNLSNKATYFMAKTTAVDYFKPYFDKLSKNIFPFIENRANLDGSYMSIEDVSKAIKDLRDKLKENVRCVVFGKNMNILNDSDLYDYEIRFYDYAWRKIHKLNYINYKTKDADQQLIIGREFNTELLIGRSEACIPFSSLGKTGVFYFKNAKESNTGVIVYVEHKKTNLEFIEDKIKDFAKIDQPVILFDKNKKQCVFSAFSKYEIPYYKTETDDFFDGFVDNGIVWKGFNTDEYKLFIGNSFDKNKEYLKKFYISIIFFVFIIIISSFLFFKNLTQETGIFISIRYKLVFLFVLAVYLPTFGLWILSYTSLKDQRIAIENDIKKKMQDILNKIDLDYKKMRK